MTKLKTFFQSKTGRAVWVVAVAFLLVAANLLLCLGTVKGAFYPDLTPEALYTVSPVLDEICGKLNGEITITFCNDPDKLLENTASRYVYILAQKLAKNHENIHLEVVNIQKNPTAVYPYRPTSATKIDPDDVIISSGGRYRVYAADSFWTISEEQNDGRYWSFNGEYKLATAMLSVTAVHQPSVYFTYGHGEAIYVSPEDKANAHLLSQSQESMRAFYQLLLSEGLKVGYLDGNNLKEIPEDAVLVIMNDPQTDYTDPDIYAAADNATTDVIHRYLAQKSGAFMLFLDPALRLPNLEQLMSHWGIHYDGVAVRDKASLTGDMDLLAGQLVTDQNQMSYSVYQDMANLQTPPRVVMPHSGSVSTSWITHEGATSSTANVTAYYSPFLTSGADARGYDPVTGELAVQNAQKFDLCALSTRIRTDASTSEAYFSYVFGSACPEMILGDYLSDPAYGNYDLMFALVRYISRTDEYASMDLGGTSLNSANMGGKPIIYGDLSATPVNVYQNGKIVFTYAAMTDSAKVWLTVLVVGLPTLVALVCGVYTYLRRRR